MILISSRLDDISTSNVIDWLYYQGKDYLRFNGDSFDALFSYRNNVLYFKSNYRDKEIPLKHIDSFWYRKCGLNIRKGNNSQANIDVFPDKSENTYNYISTYGMEFTLSEYKAYRDFIFSYIARHTYFNIGSYRQRDLNKVEMLSLAREYGLLVPQTFVLNNKHSLTKVIEKYGDVIVKPLYEGVYEIRKENAFVSYTSLISKKDLVNIPSKFPFALFQTKIEKQIEIRVIYIAGVCFSIAMFTQEYENSKIDGRKCPQENLRMTPYKLPTDIETKIVVLMKHIGLSYGALDFILAKDNNIFFLEINPVGQFSAYGNACNYYLDKILSEQL